MFLLSARGLLLFVNVKSDKLLFKKNITNDPLLLFMLPACQTNLKKTQRQVGVGKMAQWIKYLLSKHEVPSSDPPHTRQR